MDKLQLLRQSVRRTLDNSIKCMPGSDYSLSRGKAPNTIDAHVISETGTVSQFLFKDTSTPCEEQVRVEVTHIYPNTRNEL